jgi:hypothetical protein
MAPVTTDRHYRQVLSTALALRAPGIEDLVSDSIPLWNVMKRKGLMKTYSGPEIRQTLRIDKQQAQWFKGYDFLANPPIELFNDAVWTPKQVAVPISLTGEEMLANQGATQVHDILEGYMEGAETSLMEALDEGLYSDGTANDGKQISGFAAAIPITPATSGVYGGIDRTQHALWRTSSFDADTDFPDIGTQVDSTTIRPIYSRILSQRSRNTRAADLLIASEEHYWAYDAATTAIQRIARNDSLGSLGFTSIEYVGGGKRAEIVLASGLNNNMPSNTTFGIETASMRLRYHPDRNFTPLFDGDGQMPINQDAIAQFLVWAGELTLINPLFTWRLRDSDTAS